MSLSRFEPAKYFSLVFIPYRPRIKSTRFPAVTLVVTVICLLVYWAQERSQARIVQSAERYCTAEVSQVLETPQREYIKSVLPCPNILLHIYWHSNPERHLQWHVSRIEAAGDKQAAEALAHHYRAFAAQAPADLTAQLVHHSGSWNPVELLGSTIAHGSWDHVIGNLFFFAAFGVVVETVIGPVLFLLVFLAMGLGTGALENLLTATIEDGTSLGLSGVVMSVMTLAAYFAPRVKIMFFYFYFLFFGVLSWPLWSVALWYVFWNIWDYLFWRDWSFINYAAHLTGAATGLILGVTLFREKRRWVAEHLVADEPRFTDEESWLSKLNTLGAAPVVMYFVFIYGFIVLIAGTYLFVTFIQSFFAQLLIAAPVIAGVIQVYRMRQPRKPDRVRVEEGIRLLVEHKFQQAERVLKPLAESHHPRAQYALGRLYATATGGMRDPRATLRWFEAAAKRGLREAQYELGLRYLHGMDVGKDSKRAIEWLEKAATQSLPEAAACLAHFYENNTKTPENREKAIEWYYKAGAAYYKAGRLDDAKAMVKMLAVVAKNYPAVYQLVTELEKLVEMRSQGG